VWFQPDEHWAFQVSHGFLEKPEALEPGNVRRTTASMSWLTESGARFTALTSGYDGGSAPDRLRPWLECWVDHRRVGDSSPP